jgi:hypothetical protein
MRNTADVTGGKTIAVLLQSISGASAINPLVAFYDIHGGKREVLFFYFVPDTTRDGNSYKTNLNLACFLQVFDRNIEIKHNLNAAGLQRHLASREITTNIV